MNSRKLKYALEELNRYIRFIDNFSWLLSSVLLASTVYIFNRIFQLLAEPHSFARLGLVFLLCIITAFVWKWFSRFFNENILRSQILSERINLYEKSFGIDILPNFIDNPDKNINIEIFKKSKRITFFIFMKNIRNLVWLLLTISFFIKVFYVTKTIVEPKTIFLFLT